MHRQDMTQYNVTLPDRPGSLARFAQVLAREKVAPSAITAAHVGGKTAVQFISRKDAGLRRELEKAGGTVSEEQVFMLELPNHHWELHKLVGALAESGINVISMHSAVEDGRMRLVLAVDQTANAVAIAAKLGFFPDYGVC